MSKSVNFEGFVGISPLKYLLSIPIVLFNKFPKSLHKSELNLSTNPSGVNSPSCPPTNSFSKKYFVASNPYLFINVSGYITFPFDFDIFPSFIIIQPCASNFLGIGKSSAIKKIGQYIPWNLIISFPTICKSAGQYFLNFVSSSDIYPNAVI